jgi:phage terminase Nu1 subunit (DNA packaging protein)
MNPQRPRREQRPLREMSLDELTSWVVDAAPGSAIHGRMMAELARRQTIAQLEATRAQKDAAKAEKEAAKAAVDTAHYTKRIASYMFWSVLAAAASAIITAAGIAFNLFNRSN